MRIQLSDHFTYNRLYRFVFPTIVMMVFTSIYGIVDGLFVSNYVGKLPFSALNLIYPLIMILGSVGFMLGTGGNAVVSKSLGEGDREKANRIFSMLVYVTIGIGIALALIGILLAPIAAELLCASEKDLSTQEKAELIEYCILYGRIILAALPAFMLQNAFQGFFVTSEKPRLGLFVIVLAGLTNIFLDWLFVAVFQWGLAGAAIATAISQCVGGVIPVFYFARKNDSLLQLGKTVFDGKTLLAVCINGSSELLSNISASIVTILYNAQLMKYEGINGVSAYGIIMYASFTFAAIYIGYAIGSAPIVGFNYGAQNHVEMKNVFKKSMVSMLAGGVLMATLAFALSNTLAQIFVSYDQALFDLTAHGFRIYAISFLICGINIFASSFFTALGNGLISALISMLRVGFQIVTVLILPIFFQVEGIWFSIIVAEILSCLVSVGFLIIYRKRYHYA
ncbi:MAG: MATE family efflux transporter [Clostridia bacterium]|nr:MATE family efflux transporter [Clostridia bacterium]